MKKFFLLFLVAGAVFMTGCNKDKEDETTKNLNPTEAKVEVRSATQEINTQMTDVMSIPAFTSMDFMMQLIDNESWKSKVHGMIFNIGKQHLKLVKDAFRPTGKSGKEIGDYGVYQFNFTTEAFDLVEASTNMLKVSYPADENAMAAQNNNAEFTADNLQYQVITYTDTYWDEWTQTWITETYEEYLPTNASVSQKIDGSTVMTASYTASYTENGNPQAISASVTAAPYSFTMSMSGTGVNYSTMLSLKENTTELMGYDLDVTYTSDMGDVEKVQGYYAVAPLKVDGWMNYAAINNHISEIEENGGNYDLTFLNTQLSMQLIQTVLNAKIGDLQFKLYTDPEYNETYPMIAVVYSDGTYEWLEDIMGEETYKFRRMK